MTKRVRCEGFRRYGGAFTLGPPEWKQCEEDAIVIVKIPVEDGGQKEFPSCKVCWEEARSNYMVDDVRPL